MEVLPLDTTSVVFWLGGITTSSVCLLIQILLYVVVPSSRKLDQMILTQLTIARMGKDIDNFVMMALQINDLEVLCAHVTLGLNLLTDAAITFWMFIFTKNLYDKVIQVFTLRETNFVVLSVCVWLLTVPIGIVCPVFLSFNFRYCNIFYIAFVVIKFIILSINFMFFCRIFWVIINLKTDRDLKRLIKTCVVSLILLLITSLQAIVEVMFVDVSTYFFVLIKYKDLGHTFKIINSYQVLAITAIFIVLSRDPQHDSIKKTLVVKLKNIMVLNSDLPV